MPFLSAANWGSQGLHPRGNFEGFARAASKEKWLEVHGGSHWAPFYTDYGVKLQKRFFDHFLKGKDNGIEDGPPVLYYDLGTKKWESDQAWPPRASRLETFFLSGSSSGSNAGANDGTLSSKPVDQYDDIEDHYVYDPTVGATELFAKLDHQWSPNHSLFRRWIVPRKRRP